ncbi:hypothetical protein [Actinobaculum massiliense]|uniref:hypothetical protein n=1 Tax=Actinobaculum massiliense TaxID=202789 RepID=UPI0028062FFF|nr:hypothetical protein [Actinobaculum massiliense]
MEKRAATRTQASRLHFFAKPDGMGWKLSGDFDNVDGHHINAWFNTVMGRKALTDNRSMPERRAAAFTTSILNGGSAETTQGTHSSNRLRSQILVNVPMETNAVSLCWRHHRYVHTQHVRIHVHQNGLIFENDEEGRIGTYRWGAPGGGE